MMIYRDKYYDENGDDWTEIIIRKNIFQLFFVGKVVAHDETFAKNCFKVSEPNT